MNEFDVERPWGYRKTGLEGQERGKTASKHTHLVEVVLVELSHETSEVGVLELSRKDCRCERIDILYNEKITLRAPT